MYKFNKPFIVNQSFSNIKQAVTRFNISGDGVFTQKCNDFF